MLKIKLTRLGKKNQPHYRIVVNEARDKRDGSYVANLGHYIPAESPKVLKLDISEYDAWLTKGAQPTETVASLAAIARAGKGFPKKKAKLSKKAKAKSDLAKAESDSAKAKLEVKEEPVATVEVVTSE